MTKSRAELHLKGKQSFLYVSFLVFCFCCSLCKAPYLSAYMRTQTHIRHISFFFSLVFPFFFRKRMCVFLFLFGFFGVTFHGWTRVLFVSFFCPCFVCVCLCVCADAAFVFSLCAFLLLSMCVCVCMCLAHAHSFSRQVSRAYAPWFSLFAY